MGENLLLYMPTTLLLEVTPVQVVAYTVYIGVLHTLTRLSPYPYQSVTV